MERWFTERWGEGAALRIKVKSTLFRARSPYQQIEILDTYEWGRLLVLDGAVMLTERDEFAYHEMLVHVPLCIHPRPRKALVVGGGDGGAVRELLKHKSLKAIDLVEIDALVVESARRYLPSLSRGLDDPRVRVIIEDAAHYLRRVEDAYDVILIDSTDPVRHARSLFRKPFFKRAHAALRGEGLMAAQTESPLFHHKTIRALYRALREVFPVVAPYLASIPSYPGGLWSFALASKGYDPLEGLKAGRARRAVKWGRYYNLEVHRSAFSLPTYVKEILGPWKS